MNFAAGMQRRRNVSKSGAAEVETPNARAKVRQTSAARRVK